MKSQRISSIPARAALAAAIVAVLFLAATPASAALDAAARTGRHAVKLNIAVPTEVAGTLLAPGEYEVKVRNSAAGATLEFARWNYNPYAQEGLPVWDREVLATVDAVPQVLASAAMRTALLPAASPTNKAVALQIRGNAVEYGF